MISRAKGKQAQVTSYYDPDAVERLKALSETTRIPQAAYLREGVVSLREPRASWPSSEEIW